ncbi:MAG: tetratricopeptide repeat protein [Verrucomicrobiota bacterium]
MKRANEEIADQPTNGGKWYQRALLQYEHEDWTESLADLEKAEEFAPGAFPVLWMRGQISDKLGNPAEAKTQLDEFLTTAPDHWGALASRARVEVKLGLHAEALADYRKALANNLTAEPDVYNEVAQALAARHLTDEAVKVIEAGISRRGAISSLQIRALEIELGAERWDAALVRLDGIERSAPRPEPWMMKRAGIFAAAGRLSESRAVWQALISHLNSLPPAERESHSMSVIAEQAHAALTVLATAPAPRPAFVFSSKP